MKRFFAFILCMALGISFLPGLPVFAADVGVQAIEGSEQPERSLYEFNLEGAAGAKFSHLVVAEADGLITLSVSGLDKTTVSIAVTAEDGRQVFGETITGNNSRDLWVPAGTYTVTMKIEAANGAAEVGLSLLMPGTSASIAEEEPPLAGASYGAWDWLGYLFIFGVCLSLAMVLFNIKGRLFPARKPFSF